MNNNYLSSGRICFLELNNLIRRLWEEHVVWTRLLIISIANNLPDTAAVSNRLLRNATDFQNLFTYFYGRQIGEEFGNLMREHLVIAQELVIAAKNQDLRQVAILRERWYQNANDIAAFLSRINPNWEREEIRRMMFTHLRLTEDEAIAILTGQYERGITLFDEIERQALMMADIYIWGLARQFPYVVIDCD